MSDPRHRMPVTSTDLVKALDILEERLLSLPVEMITKDPWAVDVALLDHLAWENSVDVWDTEWPEDIKRNVIAASIEVHRFKGTPYAVKEALAVFDVDTDFLEWFEPQGVTAGMSPGTFRVTAYAGRSLYADTENVIDTRMIAAMRAVVRRVAPVSRGLDFRLGERFRTGVGLSTAVRPAALDQRSHDPKPRTHATEAVVSVATALRQIAVSSETHNPTPRRSVATSGTYVRTEVRAICRSNVVHNVKRRNVA